MRMSPDEDGGRSQLGVTLPNELKTAVWETAHDRRETMSDVTREALIQWFKGQPVNELPADARDNLRAIGIIEEEVSNETRSVET